MVTIPSVHSWRFHIAIRRRRACSSVVTERNRRSQPFKKMKFRHILDKHARECQNINKQSTGTSTTPNGLQPFPANSTPVEVQNVIIRLSNSSGQEVATTLGQYSDDLRAPAFSSTVDAGQLSQTTVGSDSSNNSTFQSSSQSFSTQSTPTKSADGHSRKRKSMSP